MSATVQTNRSVLVGVDGSGRNASAVAWAAAEAASSSSHLVLVHDSGQGASVAGGRAMIHRAAAVVAKFDGDLRPSSQVVSTGAARALRQAAAECSQGSEDPDHDEGRASSLVVVGRRGAGGFTRLRLGSTARMLVHRAGPPTVVVPSGWDAANVPDRAAIVVDISPADSADRCADGPESVADPEAALTLAMTRAERDDRPVVVILAWSVGAGEALEGRAISQVWSEYAARAERELAERVTLLLAAYPGVEVVPVATDRHPVAALLDHAEGAELLVLPRGWRACSVVEYAHCPVAVV